MGLFGFLKKAAVPSLPTVTTGGKLVKEDFPVVGVHYHKTSIKNLQVANEDWRKGAKRLIEEGKASQRIYHYTFINKPVRVEHEANSPHDANAMMVFVAGEHVGYIPMDQASHVRAVIEAADVKYITATVRGGEYKIVSEDASVLKWDDYVKISVRIAYAAP